MNKSIDLRSDTVTLPCDAMRDAMRTAELGDDVYAEDPSVNKLESMLARMLGFPKALFVPTGTQSNLCALLAHCQRGDEYIAGTTAHTYLYEAGGAAVLGSIQPQALAFESDGTLSLEKVQAAIRPDDAHFARTRLLCLENTNSGRAISPDYFAAANDLCLAQGLNLHLDGARLFNAAVELNLEASEITRHCDSVSVCLSKGLGAPAGSVLCGDEDFISSAHRWRKMLGGGMRQSGILAAAGIFALENNVADLANDHRRAKLLSAELEHIPALQGNVQQQTNMLFIHLPLALQEQLLAVLALENIKIGLNRWVIHRDINDQDLERLLQNVQAFF